jgi:hypothetical protein
MELQTLCCTLSSQPLQLSSKHHHVSIQQSISLFCNLLFTHTHTHTNNSFFFCSLNQLELTLYSDVKDLILGLQMHLNVPFLFLLFEYCVWFFKITPKNCFFFVLF